MLLRDSQLVLQRHLPELKAKLEALGNARTNVSNRPALAAAARALRQIPSLENLADRVLSIPLFTADSTLISEDVVGQLGAALDKLRICGQAIKGYLDAILPPEPDSYFSASLPVPDSPSTDTLAKGVNSVFAALDQPTRLLGNPPLKVSFAQPGSIWLEIFGTAGAVTVAGLLVKLATEFVRLKQERAKVEQEQHRASQEKYRADGEREKAEQERLRTVHEAKRLERELKRLELEQQSLELRVEAEVELLAQGADAPHEAAAALSNAVNQLRDLLQEGLEVRLPVDAPDEFVRVFPASALPDRAGSVPKALPAADAKHLPEGD